jgi:hypothetical protein
MDNGHPPPVPPTQTTTTRVKISSAGIHPFNLFLVIDHRKLHKEGLFLLIFITMLFFCSNPLSNLEFMPRMNNGTTTATVNK